MSTAGIAHTQQPPAWSPSLPQAPGLYLCSAQPHKPYLLFEIFYRRSRDDTHNELWARVPRKAPHDQVLAPVDVIQEALWFGTHTGSSYPQ